jgi:hypothetical protein
MVRSKIIKDVSVVSACSYSGDMIPLYRTFVRKVLEKWLFERPGNKREENITML